MELDPAALRSATATEGSQASGARPGRVAARGGPSAPIVVGLGVTDAVHGHPLRATGARLVFELVRRGEQWTGRPLTGQLLVDALDAFGEPREDVLEGSPSAGGELLCFEVDPATPRGVPVAFAVQLTHTFPLRGTYRGKGTLTLSDAAYQRLPDVACRRVDAWAAGVVIAGPHIDLEGARVELTEMFASGGGKNDPPGDAARPHPRPELGESAASVPVRENRTFSVPAPDRPAEHTIQLRVVLANGRSFPAPKLYAPFTDGIVLQLDASRSASGRLLFRGASATGLARVHAEQAGLRVGQVTLERDGTFRLTELPFDDFEVVVESSRPGGELARFPLGSLAGDAEAKALDLGTLEVASHAEVMELELVDEDGAPAAAQLHWRGRGGSGVITLRAAAVHTLLLAPVVPHDLELVVSPESAPIPLVTTPGRVRIVVGE